jgi:hypothetical protein
VHDGKEVYPAYALVVKEAKDVLSSTVPMGFQDARSADVLGQDQTDPASRVARGKELFLYGKL